MTILQYLLLITFILIEIPIAFLISFLLRHHKENGRIKRLRYTILGIAVSESVFIGAMIILVFSAISKPLVPNWFVVWSFSLATLFVFLVNWWAFFRVRVLLADPH